MNCPECNTPMIIIDTFESIHFKGIFHGMYLCESCKEHYFKCAIGAKMTSENIEETGLLRLNNN